ncbi:retinol dehydrogenase 7-like [Watersipora subatra]|uniref:retinol dehydrogenase 7-like n=1 Tax=Watersipora subatra TaxID=2589382 RepID=UPI00355B2264
MDKRSCYKRASTEESPTTLNAHQDSETVGRTGEISSFLTFVRRLLTALLTAMIFYLIKNIGMAAQYVSSWTAHVSSNRLNATTDLSKKYVLITGCDRGLGYEIAKALDRHGFSVIAGCLEVETESLRELKDRSLTNMSLMKMDVTSHDDLEKAKEWVDKNMQGELWGVVNNAGVCFFGTPEIMAQSDITRLVEVNLLGPINVIKKFLPLIRRSEGRIINIGSLNGDVPMPYFSVYNSTKAGLKVFTESLSLELKDWGVKMSLIAPSAFKTDIIQYDKTACSNKWWAEASVETKRDHGKDFFSMPMRESRRMNVSDDYSPVTDSVLHALTSNSPRDVYRVGQIATLLPALCIYMPRQIKNYICGTVLNFAATRPVGVNNRPE